MPTNLVGGVVTPILRSLWKRFATSTFLYYSESEPFVSVRQNERDGRFMLSNIS